MMLDLFKYNVLFDQHNSTLKLLMEKELEAKADEKITDSDEEDMERLRKIRIEQFN